MENYNIDANTTSLDSLADEVKAATRCAAKKVTFIGFEIEQIMTSAENLMNTGHKVAFGHGDVLHNLMMAPTRTGMSGVSYAAFDLSSTELTMNTKKTYIKINFQGGDWCICEPKDVGDMTNGADGYTTEEVQMTEAEFNELPEFQG